MIIPRRTRSICNGFTEANCAAITRFFFSFEEIAQQYVLFVNVIPLFQQRFTHSHKDLLYYLTIFRKKHIIYYYSKL